MGTKVKTKIDNDFFIEYNKKVIMQMKQLPKKEKWTSQNQIRKFHSN